MESQLTDAALLLLIGMVTVFIILFLVTLSGNLLIKVINRIEDMNQPTAVTQNIPSRVIAIAAAVVSEITDGKGQLEYIEKR